MKLDPDRLLKDEQILNRHYAAWRDSCWRTLGYLRGQYPSVKVPEHLTKVFPPIARRVIYGLAQQIPSHERRVHVEPEESAQGRVTVRAQEASSARENAHRAALALDDRYALRTLAYPPVEAALIETLLFGFSAGVILPNEDALQPEPKRKAGETARGYEARRWAWEMERRSHPPLRHHFPGILNLTIDPGLDWFTWTMRLPVAKAEAILLRWGKELRVDQSTPYVMWKEAYSRESRLVYAGLTGGALSLVYSGPGPGCVPVAPSVATKGEPALYNWQTGSSAVNAAASDALSGPQHIYQGILGGCEGILDDIARKESWLASYVQKRVGGKLYVRGDNIPADFRVDNDPSKVGQLPAGAELVISPTADVPRDVWQSIQHGHDYVDSLTQIRAIQGYGPDANSGYQQAILNGLAAATLRPYVNAIDGEESLVCAVREVYAKVSKYFVDGIPYRARLGSEYVGGRLRAEDIGPTDVEVTHEARLPQQRQTDWALWREAHQAGAATMRQLREKGLGDEDPEETEGQRLYEDFKSSDAVQQALQRRIAYEMDEDLAREVAEQQGGMLERLGANVRQNAGMGGALAPPGGGLGVTQAPQVIGQPTPAVTPESEVDLIVRQAQAMGRGRLPVRR